MQCLYHHPIISPSHIQRHKDNDKQENKHQDTKEIHAGMTVHVYILSPVLSLTIPSFSFSLPSLFAEFTVPLPSPACLPPFNGALLRLLKEEKDRAGRGEGEKTKQMMVSSIHPSMLLAINPLSFSPYPTS